MGVDWLLLLLLTVTSSESSDKVTSSPSNSSESPNRHIHIVYSAFLKQAAGKGLLALSHSYDVTSGVFESDTKVTCEVVKGKRDECGCINKHLNAKKGVPLVVMTHERPVCDKLKPEQNVFLVDSSVKLLDANTTKEISGWKNISEYIQGHIVPPTSKESKEDEHVGSLLVPLWVFIVIVVIVVGSLLAASSPFLWKFIKKCRQKKGDKKSGKKPEKKEVEEESKKENPRSDKEKSANTEKLDKTEKSGTKREMTVSPATSTDSSKKTKSPVEPNGKIQMKDALLKRTDDSVRIYPVTAVEFEHYLDLTSKLCRTYHDDPEMYDVTPRLAIPGFVYQKLPRQCPEKPEEFTRICHDLKTTVMEGMTHWQHPRFHANFPAGRSYPDILAEFFCARISVVGFSWDACPALTELEHAMINWLGRAFGLPQCFLWDESVGESTGGGAILESSSDCIFNSVVVSRQWKINQLAKHSLSKLQKKGVSYDLETMHEYAKKLVYYTSKDAQSSIEKACKLAMVRCRSIQAKGSNEWGITGTQIEQEIVKDIERGLIPTHIHVTLGTMSTASSDHLDTIWPVAKKYNMWIHVDAAYAGNCWIDPKYRTNCSGLEHAHSLNIDCDKFLLHSMPCSMIWTRDISLYQDAFAVTPVYLKPSRVGTIDLRDWSVQLSHRFKAVKTWMMLRMYGLEGVRHFVNHLIDMGAYFESLVRSHPNCRIFGHRNFGLFCFQYYEPGMTEKDISDMTTKLCMFINASHRLVFTHTKVGPHNLIRVMVSFEQTTRATVDASWCILKGHVEQFKTAKDNCLLSHLVPGSPLAGHTRSILPGDMDNDLAGSENQHTDVTMRESKRSNRSALVGKHRKK